MHVLECTNQPELRTTAQFFCWTSPSSFWDPGKDPVFNYWKLECQEDICVEEKQLLLFPFLLLLSLRWETLTFDKSQIVKWQNQKQFALTQETKKSIEMAVCAFIRPRAPGHSDWYHRETWVFCSKGSTKNKCSVSQWQILPVPEKVGHQEFIELRI